jgi:LytS/YehU family sensor histidine kinase
MKADSTWQETSGRSIRLNNLEPGHHVFQLQARNSAGILNPKPLEFSMYVTPTLLQRWWFWPGVMVVITLGIVLLARKRIQRIRREEALKTETRTMMAQLETRLLRSQMNPHFIFNSLNSIQKYIWESRQEDAAEYLASFAKLIRAILDNSRREVISLSQELEIMKLYIQLEQRRCNGRFDYHLQVDPGLPLDAVMVPPLLIQPYIENAIWHGVAKKKTQGHIGVTIVKQDDQLVLEIEDNGVGRQQNKQHADDKQSAGMEITQERIERLHTTAHVQVIDKKENGVPAGTKVIVTIPYQTERHAAVLHT